MRFLKQLVSGIALVALTAFGLTGCGGGGGATGSSTTQGPATPAGVVATPDPGNAQVSVNWQPVTGATSYNIYWGNTTGVTKANGTKISGLTATSYVHPNRATGTTYYYIVTAVNGSGESAASIEARAILLKPAGPADLQVIPSTSNVTLAWTQVPDATGYKIYRNISSDVDIYGTPIGTVYSGSVVTYIDTNATPGDTYYYKVTAILNGSETDPSYVMNATPSATPAPANPVGVVGTTFNNYVLGSTQPPYVYLTWNNVPGADRYYVYRCTTFFNAASAVKVAEVTESASVSFSDHSISSVGDQTYYYFVTAVNASGESTASHEVVALPALFTYSMVSGKTLYYTEYSDEGTDKLKLVCAPDFSVTYTGTVGGTATSGSGTWDVDGGVLSITLPGGTTAHFEYGMYSISWSNIGVVFTDSTGTQSHGSVSIM